MRRKIYGAIVGIVVVLAITFPLSLRGQDAGPAAQGTQSISQTGLLPVFAVDMQIESGMVDGAQVPSQSPAYSHSGVNDTLQQAWDSLNAAGFNIIRFPLDPLDKQAGARLANLCIWAKANNLRLIPVFKIAETNRKGKTTEANPAAAILQAAISGLRAAGAEQFAAYTQIAYFQIEGGPRVKASGQASAQELLSLAQALRDSETKALQGSGTPATPIMVGASFDYELIRQGAIAGVPLDSAAEQRALAALNQSLSPLMAGTIDAISVEWLPGSITSGDATQFPALLDDLKTTFPGKQLILTTGFSTAFNPPDQQAQFFASSVTTLGGIRAADGATPFAGVVFRQAFKGPGADAPAPNGADPGQWNWKAKAQQLDQMWSQGTQSAELTWWLKKVQDNMGILALQPGDSGTIAVVPLPAQQALQQISAAVAQASQNVAAATAAPAADATATPSAAAPAGQSLEAPAAAANNVQPNAAASPATPSPSQQMLYGILQQVTTQLTTTLTTKLTTPKQDTSANNFAATQQQYQPPVATPAPIVAPQPDPDTTAAVPQPTPVQATPASTSSAVPDSTVPASTVPATGQPAVTPTTSTNPANPTGNSPATTQGADVTRKSVPVHPHWGGRAGRDGNSTAGSTSNPNSTTSTTDSTGPSTTTAGTTPGPGGANPGTTPTTAPGTTTPSTTNTTPPSPTTPASTTPAGTPGSAVRPAVPIATRPPVTVASGTAPVATTPVATTPRNPVPTSVAPNGTTAQPVRPGPLAGVPVRPGVAPPTPSPQPLATSTPAAQNAPPAPVRPGPGAVAGVPVRPGPGTAATPTTQTPAALPARPGPVVANVSLSPAAPAHAGTPAPASSAAAATPGKTPAATAQGYFDLSVAATDIRYAPMPAQPGQSTLFVAIVRNNGTAVPPAASLVFKLMADGRQVAASPPLPVNIAAHGTAQANWSTTLPPGRQMQLVVLVTANGDQNPGNNQAAISFAPAAPPVPAPLKQ